MQSSATCAVLKRFDMTESKLATIVAEKAEADRQRKLERRRRCNYSSGSGMRRASKSPSTRCRLTKTNSTTASRTNSELLSAQEESKHDRL